MYDSSDMVNSMNVAIIIIGKTNYRSILKMLVTVCSLQTCYMKKKSEKNKDPKTQDEMLQG